MLYLIFFLLLWVIVIDGDGDDYDDVVEVMVYDADCDSNDDNQ